MSERDDGEFGGEVAYAGTDIARANMACFQKHAAAERNLDLDGTMATITRKDPFQIFHGTGLVVRGWDAVRAFYEERFRTFSGRVLSPHRIVVTDGYLVIEGRFKGSPKGMFFGVMAHGKPLYLPMCVWVYFEDGLLKGEAAYFDGAQLQRQIREGATGDARAPLV
jgi:predicted ester cyclase